MQSAALIGRIFPDDFGHLLPQSNSHDCRRIRNQTRRQILIDDHDAFLILQIHCFILSFFCFEEAVQTILIIEQGLSQRLVRYLQNTYNFSFL